MSRKEDYQKLIKPIEDYCISEGRGFIFAPTITGASKDRAISAVCLVSEHQIMEFWTTLMAIIDAVSKNISEEDRDEFRAARLICPTLQGISA